MQRNCRGGVPPVPIGFRFSGYRNARGAGLGGDLSEYVEVAGFGSLISRARRIVHAPQAPRRLRPGPVYVELCRRLEGVADRLFEGAEAVLHVMG
jgi:hypothetical protein